MDASCPLSRRGRDLSLAAGTCVCPGGGVCLPRSSFQHCLGPSPSWSLPYLHFTAAPLLLRLSSLLPGCTHPPLALGLFANCPGRCCQPRRALGCVPGVWLSLCGSVPDCHEPGPPRSAPAVAWFRRKLQDHLKHVGLQ